MLIWRVKMHFVDAIHCLLKGKFVQRQTWSDKGDYLVYLPGMTHFILASTDPKPQAQAWAPNIEDSNAVDWVSIDIYSAAASQGEPTSGEASAIPESQL
jgi:uncharacterized protein YchJ